MLAGCAFFLIRFYSENYNRSNRKVIVAFLVISACHRLSFWCILKYENMLLSTIISTMSGSQYVTSSGGKGRMGHYFRGYLAGLSILKNQTETDDVIQCLNDCREKLEVTGMNDMENGMVSYKLFRS